MLNSMKQELIAKYKAQLSTMSDQQLDIPVGSETDFWNWFERKSRIYNSKRIRKNLYITTIPIVENNFCYKNCYRIAKGFVKRLFYFEGFAYHIHTENCLRHAFNVCKHDTVFDYSLNDKPESKQDFYIGIKVPLSFARMIYAKGGDYKFTQYSLLVPYFLYSIGHKDFFQYRSL